MRIREAQKQLDLTDPDPQHCELGGGDAFVGMTLLAEPACALAHRRSRHRSSLAMNKRNFASTMEGL
jgi:hypothetical protein